MSVQTFGLSKFRSAIQNGLDLASRAAAYIESSPVLELTAQVSLGIVCFRVNPGEDIDAAALEEVNRKVLALLFWDELTFISSTSLKGLFSLRMCILNHTTTWNDMKNSLDLVVQFGSDTLKNSERDTS